ncbi:MAG: ACP S-malonyltransferase [Planctomycetes bacterium]|nr:ACP S-malonyltransferase [Planctomycetota bacterium]
MAKIALLFPGQGAQHVGMGRQIAEKIPAARQLYDQASQILGYDLAKLCFEGPKEELDTTEISQPAIFVTSLAALELLKAEHPDVAESAAVAAGLSLGEYTALVFAGALDFETGLKVVQQRGRAMQAAANATPSGMASMVMLDRDKVLSVCQQASAVGTVQIANYLCPGNIVVSGTLAAIDAAVKLGEEAGGKPQKLAVAGAFHTSIMKPADERLAEALAQATIQAPRIPVYSNVDAQPHDQPNEIRQILVRQVISPVLWEDCMRNILATGVDKCYEVGPGKVLKGLLKRIDRKVDCQSINDTP